MVAMRTTTHRHATAAMASMLARARSRLRLPKLLTPPLARACHPLPRLLGRGKAHAHEQAAPPLCLSPASGGEDAGAASSPPVAPAHHRWRMILVSSRCAFSTP